MYFWVVWLHCQWAGNQVLQVSFDLRRSSAARVAAADSARCPRPRRGTLEVAGYQQHVMCPTKHMLCAICHAMHGYHVALLRCRLVQANKNWANAEADCVSQGGHLVSILNQAESELVYTLCS